jgi:type IV pilus assembly protein PilA
VSFTRSLIARRRDEEGFTLIELMVVVLIIAILIAIAIPTFLGARQRAQDRAAQSDLRNALTAEKTVYTDNETFTATLATMQGIEPSLTWAAAPATGAVDVTVGSTATGTNDVVCVHKRSKSGTEFALADVATGANAGTYYNRSLCSVAEATVSGWSKTGW